MKTAERKRTRAVALGMVLAGAMAMTSSATALGAQGAAPAGGVPTATVSAAGVPATAAQGRHVVAGAGAMVLAGQNKLRLEDELVQYTRTATQSRTPTNMWGAEVTVVDGVVTGVFDRQLSGAPGTEIPEGGYVLSGHRASRTWLLTHARVGQPVAIGYGPSPVLEGAASLTSTPEVADEPSTVTVDGLGRTVDGVNTARAVGELVIYTPALPAVPANRWGIEAVVVDGVVTEVHDRAIAGNHVTPPVPAVPGDGFVISGHGESRHWLKDRLYVGAHVELSGPARTLAQRPAGTLGLTAPAASDADALPERVTAAYVNLRQGPRAEELGEYNVLIAAFATSRDGQTMLLETPRYDTGESLTRAIAEDHARGARWLVSVGGGVERERQTFIRTNAEADRVFETLVPIIDTYGFRGVDYNLENGPDAVDADSLLHLSQRLKDRYGSGFALTMTPRPYENFFFDIAAAHERVGLLDALQLQFYDVPEASDARFLRSWVEARTTAAVDAGVPAGKIVVGAIADPGYARGGNTGDAYADIIEDMVTERGLKGGFVWDAARERDLGYPFLVALRSR